ncbi:helix-turn-helix domain-containing protein [Promicromonospora iranensis]|uniref:DNA-binding transcriptional regulator YiaG n=1 Tax=Promicromonospora iranensis TaxID=1105144 RepID=A0ABU2CTJ1_9MICO|nr:helix-turn-helix transcriptional regulator [Promicromonospora iranensis]MDR7384663.1 DNA-binding transcriptional regulator YiaG [Promicromonospora iranensis]
MASEKRPRRVPAVIADIRRNPGFFLGAFGLSAWAYIGMSHTIAAYEGPELGYALGVAYEALVIGLAWEGRRRADRALESGRPPSGHGRWLGGAIIVGVLSGALAAWHGWLLGEGIFAASRAVAPVLAAVAVHLFFQSASSARNLDRLAKIETDRETAVLDMLDAVRLAQIAPEDERDARIADVNAAVTRVHRHVPAGVTAEVTRPHLESERTIRDVVQEAAALAGEWMPDQSELERAASDRTLTRVNLPDLTLPAGVQLGLAVTDGGEHDRSAHDEPALPGSPDPERARSEPALTGEIERVQLERKYTPVKTVAAEPVKSGEPASRPATVTDWEARSADVTTPAVTDVAPTLSTHQISEIRVLRWEQNLSLDEVAERVGVSVSAVNKYAPSTDVPTTETGSVAKVGAGRS